MITREQIEKTTAEWEEQNPILADNVIGVEIMSTGYLRYKRGNGVSAWKSLPYLDKIPPTEEAAKIATNFLDYTTANGLLIGNKTSGSFVGYRAQVLSDAINILDDNGTQFASFKKDGISFNTALKINSTMTISGKTVINNGVECSSLATSSYIVVGGAIYANGNAINFKYNGVDYLMADIDQVNKWMSFNFYGFHRSTLDTAIFGNAMQLKTQKEINIIPYNMTAGYFVFGNDGTAGGCEFRPASDNYNKVGTSGKRFQRMYCVNGVQTSSDARLKENVSDDFSKLAEAFMLLRPVTFEYADIKDGKTRIGFVAQELEKAFKDVGLDPDKFALLQKDILDPESEISKFIGDTTVYSLNYAEFAPYAIAMIQILFKEFAELKGKKTA